MKNYLTVGDIRTVVLLLLTDEHKHTLLISTSTGRLFLVPLQKLWEELQTLPPDLLAAPLAEQLTTANELHDELGTALFHFGQALIWLPLASPALQELGRQLLHHFVPSLSSLRRSYEDEAQHAVAAQPAFETLRAELEQVKLGELTLAEVVGRFLGAGQQMGQLLLQRADLQARPEGTALMALRLRSQGIKLLGQLRETLALELEHHPELPRDLDSQLFGLLDQMSGNRERRARASDRRTEPTPPITPPPAG